jgi:hypothetical protein
MPLSSTAKTPGFIVSQKLRQKENEFGDVNGAIYFMTLQLEYTCTEAEMKEAQSLNLHRQCGGGPKWRSRFIFYAFVGVIAALVYLRFKMEIAPKDRLWFVALVVVVFIALQFFKRMTRQKADKLVRLEVSEREVVFITGAGRTVMPWSAFSQCLESPTLFALLDRPKHLLYAVPKRAFPDEAAQNWFRALANQPPSVAASSVSEAAVPGRFAAKGITLIVQLKYRDYLTRMLTSWRMKGIALGIFVFVIGMFFYSAAHPPPDAVNSPTKVFLIMLATLTPMLVVVFFVVAFVSWRSEKKYLTPKQVALTSEGIEFADREGSGLLAWATYKYFLENRWSFSCGIRRDRSGSCSRNAISHRLRIWSSSGCCCKQT